MARSWREHVDENPDITQAIQPVESNVDNTRLNDLIENQRLPRAASLMRLEEVSKAAAHRLLDPDQNPYNDWKQTSEEFRNYEVVAGERTELFKSPLPENIVGLENDREKTQDAIFRLLWESGQNGGLTETELQILDGWRKRKADLSGELLDDMYNRLRVPLNGLPEDEAVAKFWRSVERTQARVRLAKHEQAEKDGIYHMPSTDHLIERMMPQVGAGRHILMMGMPGIAKSRVAFFMAKKTYEFAGTPEKKVHELTIKEDTPVGDIMGRWVIRNNETVFEEGPAIKALDEDSICVIEEFNKASDDVQTAFQRLMLLKEGETFVVQQGDARKTYTRGKNFCCIANANPDSKATARFKLDNAMRERFSGGIFESLYPDSVKQLGDDLAEIPDFVESLLVDKNTLSRKLPNKQWTDDDVEKLGKVAHWTHVLATHPGSTLKIDAKASRSRDLEAVLDQRAFGTEKYPLSEIILSPRQLEQCIRRAQSDPDLSLLDVLVQFANAPDFRTLRGEQKTFANMLVQLLITDQSTVNKLFRLSS